MVSTSTKPLPLPLTQAALARYDRLEPILSRKMFATRDHRLTMLLLDLIGRLAEDVGWAFGLDTAEINNVDTCRWCVRPGPPIPAPGTELSFVRRQVFVYRASQ